MAKAKQLPSDNWRVQAFRIVNDKKERKSFTHADKKVVAKMALDWQCGADEAQIENMTLSQAYDRYIESKSSVLSPNTYREYKGSAKRDLQCIMNLPIKDITEELIQVAINIESKKLAPKTVRNIFGLLTPVLTMFRSDLIYKTTLPQKEKVDLYIPTEKEIKALLKCVKNTEMELPIMLAAFGPMRRGEICALTKDDVKGCSVTVSKAMAKDDNKKWVVKIPKTYSGYRIIEYPKFMEVILKTVGDKTYNPGIITKEFSKILKNNNINHFRFHDLRHYCVSYLHALNIPTKYIMSRGGWSSESVVNKIYNHILTDKNDEITKQINLEFNKTFNKIPTKMHTKKKKCDK